jgi:phosphotransferase system enzyme I (PtsI)
VFEEMDDSYLRTRMDDIDHVVNRILRTMMNEKPLRHERPDGRLHGYLILADDLAPADTVLLQHQGIMGFVTEHGGLTSHTAILARSMGIPAVVGVHDALKAATEDDLVIIDGTRGKLIIGPDETTLAHYRDIKEKDRQYYRQLSKLSRKTCKTLDGVAIELQANIELPEDFDTVRVVGASGVGLYRTEFMYMNRETTPSENEHYDTYLDVLNTLGGLPLTIRTLDLGADKQVDGGIIEGPVHNNPALGLRAIRLCLKEEDLFIPQLRAILRASAHGTVRLMIPMVSNPNETEKVLSIIQDIKDDLDNNGIPYDADMPIGCMIEVPAAAICADLFAEQMDFFSIGTNDLIQYTIAIDRVNDEVNYLYDPLHPAVLRLIKNILDSATKQNVSTSMCGEMAGDIRNTRLLLGLGLREFSVHPSNVLEVKKIITESTLSDLQTTAEQTLNAKTNSEIHAIVDKLNQGIERLASDTPLVTH